VLKFGQFINESREDYKKFVQFLEFVGSGNVKLFSKEDLDEMDVIRKDYSDGKDVNRRIDKFIQKFSK